VALITGVVNVVEEFSNVPPTDAVYQSIEIPFGADALKLTVPVPTREPFVTVGALGAVFGAAVPDPAALVHPLDVCVTE
jgi:hypothetical protein